MNQTWENGQKPSFRTNFAPYGPNLGLRNFFPGFYLYMLDIVASYHCMQFQGKLKNQTWETGKKPYFWAWFWPKFGPPIFFFKNLTLSVTRNHGQLSSCTISEKTNDPILRKLVMDGQTDRQTKKRTDGQTDESDFIGCCLTNIERPKIMTSI